MPANKLRKPCSDCPWRKDAPKQYWDPQHFIDIWNNCQDDGMNTMLCHKANNLPKGAKDPAAPPCQGWIRVMGFRAIGVRILAMTGKISAEEVTDREGLNLFESFEKMLRANKIKIPKRNKWL